MLTVLLCVLFSSLTLKGLTVMFLATWFNAHPFLFLCAIMELLGGIKILKN